MTHFNGQSAVVTGAGSGIGKALALGLADRGAYVCLVERHLKALETVASSSGGAIGDQLFPYQIDLSQDKDIMRLVARLRADFRQIDILIHSAGVFARGPVAKACIADFESQYRTNVLAPYALTQALLPMLRLQSGQIVFVNSSAGLAAPKNLSQYAATKHALRAIADSLRREVNKDGIRVLSVYLGRTATPLQEQVHAMENRTYRPDDLMQPDDVATMVVNALSLPRTAEVTDIQMRSFKSL
jgi:short-subunit dehydrogenase